jgi:hypothetical protein
MSEFQILFDWKEPLDTCNSTSVAKSSAEHMNEITKPALLPTNHVAQAMGMK